MHPNVVLSQKTLLVLTPLSIAAIVAGCAVPRASGNTYGQAAGAAVIAVAGAAINRAVTHECWAMCRPGTICDKSSGLCVEPGAKGHAAHASSASPASPPDLNAPGEVYEVPPAPDTDAGAPDAGALDAGPRPWPPSPVPFVLRGPTP